MDSVLQVEQALVETLAVLFPRDSVHSGCRILPEALVRLPQERHLHVAEQRGPLLLWLLLCSLSDPLQERERAFSVLGRKRVSCSGFPLGLGPSLHRLDGRYPRLRRLPRYHALVRLLDGLFHGLRLFTFPRLPAVHHWRRGHVEVSRLPCRKLSERAELIRPRGEGGHHVHSCR